MFADIKLSAAVLVRTTFRWVRVPMPQPRQTKIPILLDGDFCLVETTGLEPVTSCV